MDVIADNIANAETTRTAEGGPYRRLRVLVSAADGPDGGVQLMGVAPDETPFKRVYDPSHPDANTEGYVDLPNVDIATEMVDMMTASRAYEANARALAMSRDMLRDAIDILS
jgi:flagellar basal-body rod protein FlgC